MKKFYVLITSIASFSILILFSALYLIENAQPVELDKENYNLRNSILKLNDSHEKLLYQQYSFLNDDNLYENYTYNFAIKIPEGYKRNNGIGKYSIIQFYNEELGYIVAINVGYSDFGQINLQKNSTIISELKKEFAFDSSLNEIFESALIDRGYNSPNFLKSDKVNYNNRDFLNLKHEAFRRFNDINTPVLISSYITYHKDYIYFIQFISYQFNSKNNWELEIDKSMSNFLINKYITQKED